MLEGCAVGLEALEELEGLALRRTAPLVGASIEGSMTPSEKGSATPKTAFASCSLLSSGSSRRRCAP